jgi:hypothetical protein
LENRDTETTLTATTAIPEHTNTAVTAIFETTTASTTAIDSEFPCPPKEIEKLWQKNTRKATKTAYQNNYIKNGFPLMADQAVIDRATQDAITANTSVEQHNTKLCRLKQAWCHEKNTLFPDYLDATFTTVRTRLKARDAKHAQRAALLANSQQTEHGGILEVEEERAEASRGKGEIPRENDLPPSQLSNRTPVKPITASITGETAPHTNGAHTPALPAKHSANRRSNGSGEPPLSLASPTVRTVFDTMLHEPTRFNWAAQVDMALGLSPPIPTKPTATPIMSQMAPRTIDVRLHTSPTKTSTDEHPQVPSKPPSPLTSPQPAPSPRTRDLSSNQ